jgi:hypothetical protein
LNGGGSLDPCRVGVVAKVVVDVVKVVVKVAKIVIVVIVVWSLFWISRWRRQRRPPPPPLPKHKVVGVRRGPCRELGPSARDRAPDPLDRRNVGHVVCVCVFRMFFGLELFLGLLGFLGFVCFLFVFFRDEILKEISSRKNQTKKNPGSNSSGTIPTRSK